jgi:phenylpropionate dioxygenase-like ring-hydroxylating dioxygenase large terminal subunit
LERGIQVGKSSIGRFLKRWRISYKKTLCAAEQKRPDVAVVRAAWRETCYLRDNMEERTVRWFMQFIFAQDKPILENQVPKRLPLDPGPKRLSALTPVRSTVDGG